MPRIPSEFRPAWWLPGPHLQTLWPTFFRPRPALRLETQRLELADGDFLDLSWSGPPQGDIVLLLHGLEGTLQSQYARSQMRNLNQAGYRTCFMHFRGCSGEPNRLPRSYHSGETGDLKTVLEHIRSQFQREVFAIVGFSLGGNVLLKWLGEEKHNAAVTTAVAISVPFSLAGAARRLNRGFSRIYQRHLIKLLVGKLRQKSRTVPMPPSIDFQAGHARQLSSFYQFDDKITAPLHGFAGADDYYQQCSSRQFLDMIKKPSLIVHAVDDPFMWPDTAPAEYDLPANVTLELSNHGGHVGFVAGRWPWKPEYWLESRVLRWLEQHKNSQ